MDFSFIKETDTSTVQQSNL